MFATLLSPADFSATQEGRIAAVSALGGPFFTTSLEELAVARAAGLQGALIIEDSGSPEMLAAVMAALQTEAEIIAIRTSALAQSEADRAEPERAAEIARLSAAL